MRQGGARGMPDVIRVTGGSLRARPQHSGIRTAVSAIIATTISPALANAAPAANALNVSLLDAYLSTLSQLDGRETVALTVTLGVFCFAVVTAILLVRTRRRLVETEAAARDEIIAAKAESDRVYALLRSEPQIMIAWAAAGDEPEIIGDPTLVTAEMPERVLEFGTWLNAEQAQAMQ